MHRLTLSSLNDSHSSSSSSSSNNSSLNNPTSSPSIRPSLLTIRDLKAPPSFLASFTTEDAKSSAPQESKKTKATSLEPNYPERAVLIRLKNSCPQLANPLLRGLDRLFFSQFLYYKVNNIPLIEFLKNFPAAADQISEILTVVLSKIPNSFELLNDFYEAILNIPLVHLNSFVNVLRQSDFKMYLPLRDNPLNLVTVMKTMIEHPADASWLIVFGRDFLLGDEEFLQKKRASMGLPPLEKEFLNKVFSRCGARPPAERKYIAIIIGQLSNITNVTNNKIEDWLNKIINSEKSLQDLQSIAAYLGFEHDLHSATTCLGLAIDASDHSLNEPELFENVILSSSTIHEARKFLEWSGMLLPNQDLSEYITKHPELANSKDLIKILNIYYSHLDSKEINEENRLATKQWWDKLIKCPAEKITKITYLFCHKNFYDKNWSIISEAINTLIDSPLQELRIEVAKDKIGELTRYFSGLLYLSAEALEAYERGVAINAEQSECFLKILYYLDCQLDSAYESELEGNNISLIDLVLLNSEKLWPYLSDIIKILHFISENASQTFAWIRSLTPESQDITGRKNYEIKKKITELYEEPSFPYFNSYPVYLAPLIHSFLQHEPTNPDWLADTALLCNQLQSMGAAGKLKKKDIQHLLAGADLHYFLQVLFQDGNVGLDLSNPRGFYSMTCLFFTKDKPGKRLAPIEALPTALQTKIASFLYPNKRQLDSQLNMFRRVLNNNIQTSGNDDEKSCLSSSSSSSSLDSTMRKT